MSLPAHTLQASPVESFALEVIGDPHREADLWSALPAHVKPERFKRNMINLFMQKPEMMQYDPHLVFREVSKAAALGLLLDPQLGEAYIVPVWNSKTRRREPELRCGYRGIIKLARQTDEIANIYPGEVRENDHFIDDEGTEKRLEHRPDHKRPRGRPYCYYAVVHYKDGTFDFEVMDMEALHDIRERSDSWKSFRAGKIQSSPWATDEGEMCKKTVLRRLLKRVPQSPELSEALAMENASDFAPNTPRLAPPPSRQLHAVEAPKTIDARAEEFHEDDGEPFEAPDVISPAQVAELLTLATEAGADIDKFCEFMRVASLEEIPASRFEAAIRALEAKRLQAARGPVIPPSPETPAPSLPAGQPASEASPQADDAGDLPAEEKLSPMEEARQAGRSACEAGVDFKDIPEKYAHNAHWRKAWKDGYQKQAEEMGA